MISLPKECTPSEEKCGIFTVKYCVEYLQRNTLPVKGRSLTICKLLDKVQSIPLPFTMDYLICIK